MQISSLLGNMPSITGITNHDQRHNPSLYSHQSSEQTDMDRQTDATKHIIWLRCGQ